MKTLSRVPSSSSSNVVTDLFTLAKIGQSDNTAIRNNVLVRCSRDRVMPVGLEITEIVVPKQLQNKLLTVAHEYTTSGHLGVKKTIDT